jgi:hypothetical protein
MGFHIVTCKEGCGGVPHTLLVEMALDSPIEVKGVADLQLLVNVEVMLCLSYILLLLESILLSNSAS